MTLWTRIPTVIGGTTAPDDWIVIYAGTWRVARIYAEWTKMQGHHWRWFTWTHEARHGNAATLEEAQERVKAAVVIRGGEPDLAGDPKRYRVR